MRLNLVLLFFIVGNATLLAQDSLFNAMPLRDSMVYYELRGQVDSASQAKLYERGRYWLKRDFDKANLKWIAENPDSGYFEANADFTTYWQYTPFQGETHKIRVRISLLCTDTSYFLVVTKFRYRSIGNGLPLLLDNEGLPLEGWTWVSKKNSRKYLGTIDTAIKEKMRALDHEMKR